MEVSRLRSTPRAARPAAIVELVREARAIGLVLSEDAVARFEVYLDTLLIWRQRLALTAAATPLEVVRSHILDSLAPWRFVKPACRLADLGSGAGFPGIPLAIACDRSHVALVEARRKKANFLREVVRSAGLENVEVIEARAESLAQQVFKPWDIVVSRAVWRLSDFLAISEQLLVAGGLAIAMKGLKASAEVMDYHGALRQGETVQYRLPGGARHLLLVYRKE